jgi:hypothetical protein
MFVQLPHPAGGKRWRDGSVGINPAILIASLMVASVPILLAALGELVVESAPGF